MAACVRVGLLQQGPPRLTPCEAAQVLHKGGNTLTVTVCEGFSTSTTAPRRCSGGVTVSNFVAGVSGRNIL